MAVAIDDLNHGSEALAVAALAADPRRPLLGAAILDAATAWDAELIVMGRNPRRLFGSLFWRRISDQVMHEAPCPVSSSDPRRLKFPSRICG